MFWFLTPSSNFMNNACLFVCLSVCLPLHYTSRGNMSFKSHEIVKKVTFWKEKRFSSFCNIGQISANRGREMAAVGDFWPLPGILITYLFHIWCRHSLGESSKYESMVGHIGQIDHTNQIGGFGVLSWLLMTQYNSYVVYTLVRWGCGNSSIFGHVGQMSAF